MRKTKFFISFFLFLGIASVAVGAQAASSSINEIDMVQTDKYMYMSEPNEGVVYVFDNNNNGAFVKKISFSYAGSPLGGDGKLMNLMAYHSNTVTNNYYILVSFSENKSIAVISEQTLKQAITISTTKKPYDLAYDDGYLLVSVSRLNNGDYLPFSIQLSEGGTGLPQRTYGTVDYEWQNSEINSGTVFIGDEHIESVGSNQFEIFGIDPVQTFETYSISSGIPSYENTGIINNVGSYSYKDFVVDSTGTYGYYVASNGFDYKKVHILQEPNGSLISDFELNDETNSVALSHDAILYVGMNAPDGPDVIQYEVLPGVTPSPMIRYLFPSAQPLLTNGLSASAKAVYAVTPEFVYLLDGNVGGSELRPIYSFGHDSADPSEFLAISDFKVQNITDTSADVCWEYDYPGTTFYLQWGENQANLDGSNSQVEIKDHGYCYTIGDPNGLLLLHPDTTYFVHVKSQLDSIPSTTYLTKSDILSFTTLADNSSDPLDATETNPRPDLQVTNISFVSANNQINQVGKLSVTIKNNGEPLTTSECLKHWEEDADFGSFQTGSNFAPNRLLPSVQSPLNKNDEIIFTWEGSFTQSGQQLITYHVDISNVLDEENEDNNSIERVFNILEPGISLKLPDLVAGRVEMISNPAGGYSLEYYYRNIGDAKTPMPEIFVAVKIDGNSIDNVMVLVTEEDDNFAQDMYKAYSLIPFDLDPGVHLVEFTIDPDNMVVEKNENNNIYKKSISVPVPGEDSTRAIDRERIQKMTQAARDLVSQNIEIVLDQIGELRDQIREQSARLKYLNKLSDSIDLLTSRMQEAINSFVTYGSDNNTKALGEGERAAVIYSYKQAYNKLPSTEEELADAIKIANGRWPSIKSPEAEKKAKERFQEIYKKIPDMENPSDNAAVTVMAYGLRQTASNRNLESEKAGIKTFTSIYGHAPSSTEDWNMMQAITYSGSSRGIDSDGDFLIDSREIELGTDPHKRDTDGDGYLDGVEVANGFDPLSRATR